MLERDGRTAPNVPLNLSFSLVHNNLPRKVVRNDRLFILRFIVGMLEIAICKLFMNYLLNICFNLRWQTKFHRDSNKMPVGKQKSGRVL